MKDIRMKKEQLAKNERGAAKTESEKQAGSNRKTKSNSSSW